MDELPGLLRIRISEFCGTVISSDIAPSNLPKSMESFSETKFSFGGKISASLIVLPALAPERGLHFVTSRDLIDYQLAMNSETKRQVV